MSPVLQDGAPASAVEAALVALDAPAPRDTPGDAPGVTARRHGPGDAQRPTPPAPRSPSAHAPAARTPSARTPGQSAARDARPRLRLVPAPAAARPETAAGPAAPPLLADRLRNRAELDRLHAAEPDDDRGAAPATDPARFAHGVGLACVEVVLGRRPAAQLARWVTPEVLGPLQERAALVRRAGVLTHARRPAARRVRACPIDSHTVEACLVVDDGVRVRAVAIRLEAHRGAWRAAALEIG